MRRPYWLRRARRNPGIAAVAAAVVVAVVVAVAVALAAVHGFAYQGFERRAWTGVGALVALAGAVVALHRAGWRHHVGGRPPGTADGPA